MSIFSKFASLPTTAGNKRKRDEDSPSTTVKLDETPFTIKADNTNPFAKPPSFIPISLLPRSDLPLAYLDPTPTGNRLFSAHLHALEACIEDHDLPYILIVQEEKERRLYAIERVHRRTYALCQLRTTVKREDVGGVSQVDTAVECRPPKRPALDSSDNGRTWWARMMVNKTDAAPDAYTANDDIPKLAMSLPPNPEGQDGQQGHGLELEPDQGKKFTPQDHLRELSKQYLDALYMSRTSLAYFTKGPLSRTRAAFASTSDPDLRPSVLIAFLRDSILTASTMDKKYRETVAGIVKELPLSSLQTPETTAKRKRKRKWKSKRDKAGFFVDEKDHVEEWWHSENVSGSSAENITSALSSKIPRLRSRETYLQVVLILEVLALESAQATQHVESQAPNPPKENERDESTAAPTKPPKAKKPQDLNALLETLVEKLGIWHSLEGPSPAAKRTDDSLGAATDDSNDELRNFCVDVVIPFFMSRISKVASMVNKKLGGPSAPTPIKRKQSSSRKPGAPAARQPPHKVRKPLSRTGTDTLAKTARIPQLQRAATDSQFIKREGSVDIALSAIPPKSSQPEAGSRKRVSLMDSLKARQVDFSAVSQATDAKLRKKAEMQEKLKEAVDAIRKPNRDLAVKEIADNADASFAKAVGPKDRTGQGRKKAVSSQKVAIEATPKHPRTVKATPGIQRRYPPGTDTWSSVPASFVPASVNKGSGGFDLPAPSSGFAVPATGHRQRHGQSSRGVEDTPSRGFGKFMPQPLFREPGTLAESPLATRLNQAIDQTPIKPLRPLHLTTAESSAVPEVAATPSKRLSSTEPLLPTSSNPQVRFTSPRKDATAGAEPSIYAALGWDEDDYEELA